MADEATARGSECVSCCCATEQQETQNHFFFFEVSLGQRTFLALAGRHIHTGSTRAELSLDVCL